MITIEPIGYVRCDRAEVRDDFWGGMESRIVLDERFPEESFAGIEQFSHLEIIFHFHQVDPDTIVVGKRHPRGNPALPEVGIFSRRGRRRPNRLGLTIVDLIRREGRTLHVRNLDAIDGTPVIDIKPVLKDFLPQREITQPAWCDEVMKKYWRKG
jgi:tRNA-Thr(GGU) m(6)t(6)A37 methyltransferase TsaA